MLTGFDLKELLEKTEEWVFANRKMVVVSLLGVLLIGGGLFIFSSGVFEPTKVEILTRSDVDSSQIAGASASMGKVVVEIAGAVQKAGVYEVDPGDRVDKILVLAGGLAAEADRGWVSKNLNRAARITDGQKIYIPRQGETTVYGQQSTVDSLLNLNTASQANLERLSGIGAVRAQAIISGRPYSNVEELVSKKIIPKSVYEKIKGSIAAP